jgi:hypothetical protein
LGGRVLPETNQLDYGLQDGVNLGDTTPSFYTAEISQIVNIARTGSEKAAEMRLFDNRHQMSDATEVQHRRDHLDATLNEIENTRSNLKVLNAEYSLKQFGHN